VSMMATEAEGRDRGSSVLEGAGGLKTLGRTLQHVEDAEGLKDTSKGVAEELTEKEEGWTGKLEIPEKLEIQGEWE